MEIVEIKCSGCGMMRKWRGYECLTFCDCLADKPEDESNLLDAQVIICPDCLGTGKEICSNPDHGFMDAVGTVRLNGHANGCPCCGNDELHRISNTTCGNCNGTGKL